jgi:hypothetical protein
MSLARALRSAAVLCLVAASAARASTPPAEIILYGFEGSLDGWRIPEWARGASDYVAEDATASRGYAQEGQYALEVSAAFPEDRWACAYVEHEVEVTDWTPFGRLSVDVYLPSGAPPGLAGRIILTVGGRWQWTEMEHPVPLTPGAWTTLTVGLKPGSMDWPFDLDDAFRADVRKVGVRIEAEKGPAYRGSVFIDRVRLAE